MHVDIESASVLTLIKVIVPCMHLYHLVSVYNDLFHGSKSQRGGGGWIGCLVTPYELEMSTATVYATKMVSKHRNFVVQKCLTCT